MSNNTSVNNDNRDNRDNNKEIEEINREIEAIRKAKDLLDPFLATFRGGVNIPLVVAINELNVRLYRDLEPDKTRIEDKAREVKAS